MDSTLAEIPFVAPSWPVPVVVPALDPATTHTTRGKETPLNLAQSYTSDYFLQRGEGILTFS